MWVTGEESSSLFATTVGVFTSLPIVLILYYTKAIEGHKDLHRQVMVEKVKRAGALRAHHISSTTREQPRMNTGFHSPPFLSVQLKILERE